MTRSLLKAQVLILAVGRDSSWSALVSAYRRFFAAGRGVFEPPACTATNPLGTRCLSGAIFYLSALLVPAALRRVPGMHAQPLAA
jgi:hypothetical protein